MLSSINECRIATDYQTIPGLVAEVVSSRVSLSSGVWQQYGSNQDRTYTFRGRT